MSFLASSFIFMGILSGGYILYEDIKTQKVSFLSLILLFLSIWGASFYLHIPLNYFSGCCMSFLFFLFWSLQKIGSADVFLVGVLGLIFPPIALPLFLIISGILGVFFFFLFKNKTNAFPFTPALFLGGISTAFFYFEYTLPFALFSV